jgi:hypothetical protein
MSESAKNLLFNDQYHGQAHSISQHCAPSDEGILKGTSLTIYFLALEHFCNRYPKSSFLKECLKNLKNTLQDLHTDNQNLFFEIRNFVSAMPLDAISQSAHPKKLKQTMLKSILSIEALNIEEFVTESNRSGSNTYLDIKRDLQYYIKLCELSKDPLKAREILALIVKASHTLNNSERNDYLRLVNTLPFKYMTDRAFCLNKKMTAPIISLTARSIINPVSTSQGKTNKIYKDVSVDAIKLFKEFEICTKAIVSEGGETYEALQQRAQRQKKSLEKLSAEVQSHTTEYREALYRFSSTTWPSFIKDDLTRQQRLVAFLNFISNPA